MRTVAGEILSPATFGVPGDAAPAFALGGAFRPPPRAPARSAFGHNVRSKLGCFDSVWPLVLSRIECDPGGTPWRFGYGSSVDDVPTRASHAHAPPPYPPCDPPD